MGSRRYWLFRFLLGLLLLAAGGCGLPAAGMAWYAGAGRYFLFDVAIGVFGFWLALGAVTPLVHLHTARTRLRADIGGSLHDLFERAALPRRIFFLLLAVAEIDGRAGTAERQLVRRFLRERFLDPVATDELVAWEAQGLPTRNLAALAADVARDLDPSERDTLFYWCCLVAFADGRYGDAEHAALQRAAQGLRLQPHHARSLFEMAKQEHLRNSGDRQQQQQQQQQHQQQGQKERRADAAYAPGDRLRALAVLDLPPDASLETIRRRHRELVKKFHPDAQPNLGPTAQRDATERFRSIQRAYEILTT